ncbi:cache domain-containing sensor histidine kinase [Paenibacillus lentus]|uniref:Sensor histidine kinase n=1 Tax=Paenibacillus lentus TaxID=1338368 RepID=A0A3Q8SBA2_9BACL|nr:sensor histidine kinase [Paenibacillus lentus]AZK46743.1 sensor histidine kinase [Paenibacillus lentus]
MRTKIVRLLNDLKLKHKLLMTYIVVVMLPVLIIGGAVTGYFRAQAMDRAIEQTTNDVQKIKSQLTTMLRAPTDISNTMMFDKTLQKMVTTQYPNVLELTKAYLAYEDFKDYVRLYREISAIRFYYDNPTLINNMELIPLEEATRSTAWYQRAMQTKSINWFYIHDEEDVPVRKLSLVRQIPFPEYRSSGVLMIVMDQEELNRMLRQEQFETLIFDEQGYIIAGKNPKLVGQNIYDLDYGINLHQQVNGAHKMDVNGEPSYLVIEDLLPESSVNGLKIVSVFATDAIVKDANTVSFLGLIFVLLVLLIALLFVYIVSFLMTNRLLRLSRHFNRLALGDLAVVSSVDGNDEIGQLSRQFNYMVESIKLLMNQVVEKTEQNNSLEIAQREIKLKMLASQINPHFLFNALESIRMNAHMKGEKEIANVVRLLGKLMRKNLEVGREQITLKEELDMVRSYLEIQKFRYEDRLNYELIIDRRLEGIFMPPLIIQPLVENAVVHGVENKESGVKVKLIIQIVGEHAEIMIEDDGVGMTPERLDEVRNSLHGLESGVDNRIGLSNVQQRLVMTFGEQHGLNISSKFNKGTQISFTIPLKKGHI